MKTSGVLSCETKFGLLFFLGHHTADGRKDLEDDKSCIEGLMTLGGLESDLHAHLVHSHGVAD